jgi:hypothetical protein
MVHHNPGGPSPLAGSQDTHSDELKKPDFLLDRLETSRNHLCMADKLYAQTVPQTAAPAILLPGEGPTAHLLHAFES